MTETATYKDPRVVDQSDNFTPTIQPPSEIALLEAELRATATDRDEWKSIADDWRIITRKSEAKVDQLTAQLNNAIAAIKAHIASEEMVKFSAQEAARVATYPKDAAAAKYGEAIADAKIEAYQKALKIVRGDGR